MAEVSEQDSFDLEMEHALEMGLDSVNVVKIDLSNFESILTKLEAEFSELSNQYKNIKVEDSFVTYINKAGEK